MADIKKGLAPRQYSTTPHWWAEGDRTFLTPNLFLLRILGAALVFKMRNYLVRNLDFAEC